MVESSDPRRANADARRDYASSRNDSRSAPVSRLPSPPPSLPARPMSPDYIPPPSRGIGSAADSPRRYRDRSPPPRGSRRDDDRRYIPRDRELIDRDRGGGRERDFGGRDRPPHPLPPFRGTFGGGDERSRSSTPRAPYRNSGSPYGGPNLESRREEREKVVFSIWPPSPERPYAEVLEREARDQERKSSSRKKSSRRRRYSSDEDSEDERERRRRRRKEKERRRERDGDDRKQGDGDRKRDDEWAEVRRSRSPKRSRRSTRSRSHSRGIERRELSTAVSTPPTPAPAPAEDDDGPEVGPQPPSELKIAGLFEREANKNLLPGEAAAMRQYVESGQRIPRRGEIGLDQNKIMQYEASGFVMSGSRNARMNAVRVRKEQQVINSQDKIELIKTRKEEADRKEGEIISQFKEIVEERLREGERKRRDRG